MPVLDKPILHYLVERLKKVELIDFATTINFEDDFLVAFAKEEHIKVFRGSEDDVMARVLEAAKSVQADVNVEVTGDCPIIAPDIIEQTIRMYTDNDFDYVSNVVIRSYPDGMDTQVF